MHHILSLDGGGVCGAFSSQVLARLYRERPSLLSAIDLVAGTSTGGLIALCIAKGMYPDQIVDLYRNRAKDIFYRSWLRWLAGNLCSSKYDNAGLIKVCQDTFGQATLNDLTTHVVIPAFNLKEEGTPSDPSWRCEFFTNLAGSTNSNDLLADVAVRTASAPTYFPSYQGYIDGGVVANDPTLAAIAHAIRYHGVTLDDIRVLSISTGGQIKYIDGQDIKWGITEWLKPLVGLFMDGQVITVDLLAGLMLVDKYIRVSPIIPGYDMDDVAKIPDLIGLADKVDLAPILAWLDVHFLETVSDLVVRT